MSMEICSSGHDEIVFDKFTRQTKCPCCEMLVEMGKDEAKIERLEELQETILEAAEEWAGYVTADDAPRTLIDHLRKVIDP